MEATEDFVQASDMTTAQQERESESVRKETRKAKKRALDSHEDDCNRVEKPGTKDKQLQEQNTLWLDEGHMTQVSFLLGRIIWNEEELIRDSRDDELVRLDRACLEGVFEVDKYYRSGCQRELLLYRRKAFNEQWRFLQEEVINKGMMGWIQGPSGTGKSTTTVAFSLSLDVKEWSVTYLKISEHFDFTSVQFIDGKRRWFCSEEYSTNQLTKRILSDWSDGKKHLLILDGYWSFDDKHHNVYMTCLSWNKKDRQNRRFVAVSSMIFRPKAYSEEDRENNLKEHIVPSWTMEEYQEAVKHEELYNLVEPCLDVYTCTAFLGKEHVTKDNRMRCKYYVAGGSCRYMFDMKTSKVFSELDYAIARASDISAIFQGNSKFSAQKSINRLIASIPTHNLRWSCFIPVSRYVATELAPSVHLSLLKSQIDSGIAYRAREGFLLEMLFLKGLSTGSLHVTCRDTTESKLWKPYYIIEGFTGLKGHQLPSLACICWKLLGELDGGYDYVLVHYDKRTVDFVMLTVAERRSLKLSLLSQTLVDLRIPQGRGWKVDIIFITPKRTLATFAIEALEDSGALKEYGWEAGKEKDKVKVACFELRYSVSLAM
eukprot:763895-Hanusia_phi.AAC.8